MPSSDCKNDTLLYLARNDIVVDYYTFNLINYWHNDENIIGNNYAYMNLSEYVKNGSIPFEWQLSSKNTVKSALF